MNPVAVPSQPARATVAATTTARRAALTIRSRIRSLLSSGSVSSHSKRITETPVERCGDARQPEVTSTGYLALARVGGGPDEKPSGYIASGSSDRVRVGELGADPGRDPGSRTGSPARGETAGRSESSNGLRCPTDLNRAMTVLARSRSDSSWSGLSPRQSSG